MYRPYLPSGKIETHDDVLVVVAETATEDVDAPRVGGIFFYADFHPDRVVLGQADVVDCDVGDRYAVYK